MATRIDNNKIIIETALNVKNMSERLFGGPGQPDGGAIHFIVAQHKELSEKLESNKQELLEKIDAKKAETDTAIEKVEKDQQDLDSKVNRVVTAGVTVNAIAGLLLAWLGVRHQH